MNHLALPRSCRVAICLLLASLLGLMLMGCEVSEPALPSYTLRLSIPLGEERIDILDATEDEDYLIALEDGTLGFWVSGDPNTVSLDFDLGVDVPRQEIHGELGAFPLHIDASTDFTFSFVDLFPEAEGLDGQEAPVPGFSFEVRSDAGSVVNLESATLTAGVLRVTIGNDLPVPISDDDNAQHQIVLDLLDAETGEPLQGNEGNLRLYFARIETGEVSQESVDLAGVNLPGQIAVRLEGGSPGSGGDPVTITSQASISVEAAFMDIVVENAFAVVPAQSFTTSFTTPLPADYGVMEAVIDAGSLTVTVANEMPIPCHVVIIWPQVFDPYGEPLERMLSLSAGQTLSSEVDFSGCVIRAQDSEALDALAATVSVSSPGSGEQPVALQANQGVEAITSSGRMEFVSITGTVPELSYGMQPTEQEIDLPDELDGLLLSRAELILELASRTSVPALVQFDLIGINKDGALFPMTVEQRIEAALEGEIETTRFILDGGNSDIVHFLNHMPTAISLTGNVQIGWEAGVTGTVQREDYAVINWEIIAPVEVRILSSQLYGTVKKLDLGDDARNRIQDHFGAAEIELEVLNHLPVGINARLLLGPDRDLIKDEPMLVIGPVTIDAGNVSPDHGHVSEPFLSRPLVSLTSAQTKLLATPDMHSLVEIHLHDTGDEPVRVLVTDYISVKGMIRLDIDVHDNP